MPDSRVSLLIARKMAGEATEAELQELREYFTRHPGEQYLYEIVEAYWSRHPDLFREDTSDEQERFERILHSEGKNAPVAEKFVDYSVPETPLRKLPYRGWGWYAAAAVLITASIVFYQGSHRRTADRIATTGKALPAKKMSEVVARPGSKSKLVLPDGTRVWLNGGSRLTYAGDFNQHLREVSLEGEAFFDVTHDKNRPFIVHTSGLNIQVLGTEFNVKSYAEDKTIEATLIRGSIEVIKKDDPASPKVILRPHEKLVFNKALQTTATSPADSRGALKTSWPEPAISVTTLPKDKPDSTQEETSWIYDKLVFDGDRFDEVAKKMERWYDVTILIRDERLKQVRLKGIFENETVRQALNALRLTAPFDYVIQGDTVRIFPPKTGP